jgi:hypothetical protein
MCIESERKKAFFSFLYYCIISIGCWVIVGRSVEMRKKIEKFIKEEVINTQLLSGV